MLCTLSMAHAADEDALALADATPGAAPANNEWRGLAEYALSRSQHRDGSWATFNQRLSLDLRWDKPLAPGLRFFFADRLDLNSQDQPAGPRRVNTLKEAYLGWRATDHWLADAGRINMPYGVGLGYNPTDFFRNDAVRSLVSVDPMSLRTNRLGSFVLRNQVLWESGSLTAVYSPELSTEAPSGYTFSPEISSTNHADRWLLAFSHRAAENFNPQILLYHEAGRSLQLGANLSVLLGNSTVAYFDWAGGRSNSLLSQALNVPEAESYRNRLATGLTYTTGFKMTLSAEYEYNGTGLNGDQWQVLGSNQPAYTAYRVRAQQLQDLPTRRAMFFSARWQDAFVNRFDLSALARVNLDDDSYLWWVEAVRRFDLADVALQLQRQEGDAMSEFGALPDKWAWQMLVRYNF